MLGSRQSSQCSMWPKLDNKLKCTSMPHISGRCKCCVVSLPELPCGSASFCRPRQQIHD